MCNSWNKVTGRPNSRNVSLESKPTEEQLSLPTGFKSLCNWVKDPASRPFYEYLSIRGLTREDVLKWKIGYVPVGRYSHRIVIPSFDRQGALNYFIARTIKRDGYKYKNPKCSKDIIFNDLMVNWDKPIVLVEGVFDAIKFENSIPLLGSTLHPNSRLFKKICQTNAEIYLGLDKDASRKEDKIIKSLLLNDIKIHKMPTPTKGDYADLTKEECSKMKENSHFVQGTDYLLYKKIFLEDF